jgi:hypothetical protein
MKALIATVIIFFSLIIMYCVYRIINPKKRSKDKKQLKKRYIKEITIQKCSPDSVIRIKNIELPAGCTILIDKRNTTKVCVTIETRNHEAIKKITTEIKRICYKNSDKNNETKSKTNLLKKLNNISLKFRSKKLLPKTKSYKKNDVIYNLVTKKSNKVSLNNLGSAIGISRSNYYAFSSHNKSYFTNKKASKFKINGRCTALKNQLLD